MQTTYDTTGNPIMVQPKKKGCGCFSCGCLGFLIGMVFLVIGAGVAIWMGIGNFQVPDPVVLWTYENVVRPKVEENLPPNLKPAERRQILNTMDFGVQRYTELSSSEKSALMDELMTASYYYSRNEMIPPDKIPVLTKFIEDTMKAYQTGKPKR